MLSLGTWLTSNIGGFVVGLLLGVVGSSVTFGWLPDQEPRVSRRKRREEGQGPSTTQTFMKSGPLPDAGKPA
jgi:hypothetical protein